MPQATDWEIHSPPPQVDGGDAHWSHTEAYDRNGSLRLLVEEARAKRIL